MNFFMTKYKISVYMTEELLVRLMNDVNSTLGDSYIAKPNDVDRLELYEVIRKKMENYTLLVSDQDLRDVKINYDNPHDGTKIKSYFYIGRNSNGKTILHYKLSEDKPEDSIPLSRTFMGVNYPLFKVAVRPSGGKKTRKRRNRRLSKRRKSLIRRNYPDFR